MLKVGDKLLCKKTYNHFNCYNIVEGEYYEISYIINYIYFDNNYFFSLDPNHYWYIWNWFYKPQEIRKLKLKQLIK